MTPPQGIDDRDRYGARRGGAWRAVASLVLVIAASIAGIAGCEGESDESAGPVRIAAAISLREVLTELAARYEAETGHETELSFASSGQLVGQVRGGAPIDLFLSAGDREMDQLVEQNLIDPATRRTIAGNRLVLIVPAGADDSIASFNDLTAPAVQRLAIGEPATVPAGRYAKQTLETLGLWEGLQGRLIYGTNVRQVLDYVQRGEVAAAIVYRTDAMEAGESVRPIAAAEAAWHDPVEYVAGIVTGSKQAEAAQGFLDFLQSEEAAEILGKYGFEPAGLRSPAAPE